MTNPLQDKIQFRLPVKIAYSVLEKKMQEKIRGEFISSENKKGEQIRYAQIQDAYLQKSNFQNYDLAVKLQFKTLTSLFKNKEAGVLIHLALNFDKTRQEISVLDFDLEGVSNNWLMDTGMQTVANNFMYRKIKEKMSLSFAEKIEEELQKINQKLKSGMEVVEGIALSGYLERLKISDFIPGDSLFLVFVQVEGFAIAEVDEIPSG